MGVMLAIFFGTGMMLLRWMQRVHPPIPGRSGLDDYLFGMAAAMTMDDLWMIGGLGALSILMMLLFWSRLKVLTFDARYAAGLGLSVRWLEMLMLCLMVVGIVIGLQIVGVVLDRGAVHFECFIKCANFDVCLGRTLPQLSNLLRNRCRH